MRTIAANVASIAFALGMVGAASAADLSETQTAVRECTPLVKNATPIRLECPLINGKIDERYCVCPEDVPPVLVSAQ